MAGFHHTIAEARVDRVRMGREFQGHLLATEGEGEGNVDFFAHYVDGVTEEINPPTGTPRPEPDPAVRTKFLKLPDDIASMVNPTQFDAQMPFSGQMRRLVQCWISQGKDHPFSATYDLTHGILEYPFPRIIGATEEEEKALAAQRRFWLIEISEIGVYAAPIRGGVTCLACVQKLSEYRPSVGADVSLAWKYLNQGDSDRVRELIDGTDMQPCYPANLSVHNPSWAFSASGRKAANVCSRWMSESTTHLFTGLSYSSTDVDPDPGWTRFVYEVPNHGVVLQGNEGQLRLIQTGGSALTCTIRDADSFFVRLSNPNTPNDPSMIDRPSHYLNKLIEIDFTVTYPDLQSITITHISGTTYLVEAAGHGLTNGMIAIIDGADQTEYNGAHVVSNAQQASFRIQVEGSPASPATGPVKLKDYDGNPTLEATLTVGDEAQYNFGSSTASWNDCVFWYPRVAAKWVPLFRTPGSFWDVPSHANNCYPQDVPMFVFYQGEDQILLRWWLDQIDNDPLTHEIGFYVVDGVDHVSLSGGAAPQPQFTSAAIIFRDREALALLLHEQTDVDVTTYTYTVDYSVYTRSSLDEHLAVEYTIDTGALDFNTGIEDWFSGLPDPQVWGFVLPYAYGLSPLLQRYAAFTDIQAVGGGLCYEDPHLTPADQTANRFRIYNAALIVSADFETLVWPDRFPHLFVGQV